MALQRFELGLQAGLVGGPRFLEQLALLGAHALGPGAKAPGLQARELVRDALNLDVAQPEGMRLEIDLLSLLSNVLALFGDVLKHLGGHFGQCTKTQTVQVLSFEFVHVEHACIVQSRLSGRHWDMCRLLGCAGSTCDYLHARNHLHLLQPLPGQAQHQGVKLRLCQRHRRRRLRHLARPCKAALPSSTVQRPRIRTSPMESIA